MPPSPPGSKMARAKPKPHTLISMFSGAGGLDLGLERAGFQTRVMVEVDRDARATVEANKASFGHDFPILEDVTKVSAQDLLEASGLKRGEPTLLAGGSHPASRSARQASGSRSATREVRCSSTSPTPSGTSSLGSS